jgi:dihydroxyacetone kinase
MPSGYARSTDLVRLSLQKAYAMMRKHEPELGQLDAAAGDGDHGAAMVRGTRAAADAVAGTNAVAAGPLMITAGAAFSDAAGGASGALYGTFLSTIGQKLGEPPYNDAQVVDALQAGADVIAKLGRAQLGDKTMLDALVPFVAALSDSVAAGVALPQAWCSALADAEAGAEATKQMVGRRGRSSRLGERSLGHADPGAVSMVYLLQATSTALDEIYG